MPDLIQPKTQRLQLRQWQQSDFSDFAKMNADPAVMEYYPALLTRQESDALALRCQTLIEQQGWSFWAAELSQSNEFIGFLGLHHVSDDLPFAPAVEIGWRLARPFWGKGYATEGAQAALEVAFKDLQLAKIVSFTSILNIRSQKVMLRLGMQRNSNNFNHPKVPRGHKLEEHCLYELSKAQWQRNTHEKL